MRGRDSRTALLVFVCLVIPAQAGAQEGYALRSGAIELGLAGSVTSVEGATSSLLRVDAGVFRTAGGVMLEYGGGAGWSRVSELDVLDLEGSFSALRRLGDSSTYALLAVTAALRQEWVGSFNQVRYPVGVSAGFKALAAKSAAGTLTYEYRRILEDPVRPVNEHRFVVALSILFRNH